MISHRHHGVFLLALAVAGCSHVPRATQGGKLADIWSTISTKDRIRTRGVGAAPTEAKGQTRRRGASRNAALVMARKELLATIRGVRISGGVTIAQLAERDGLIRELADDMVKGAEEVLTEFLADDGAVVTLELKRATVERLIQQKTQREVNLEKRVARDIKEIEKLNARIVALGWDRFQLDREIEIKKHAARLQGIVEEVDRISTTPSDGKSYEQMSGDLNRLLYLSERLDRLADEDPEEAARAVKNSRDESQKAEADCRADPGSECMRQLTMQCYSWARDTEDCLGLIRDDLFAWDTLPNAAVVRKWRELSEHDPKYAERLAREKAEYEKASRKEREQEMQAEKMGLPGMRLTRSR